MCESLSLFEMIEFDANFFYFAGNRLIQLQEKVKKGIKDRGGSALPTQEETAFTSRTIRRFRKRLDPVAFDPVLTRISTGFNIDEPLLQPLGRSEPFTLAELSFELKELQREMAEALSINKFIILPASDAGFFDNYLLFGFDVAKKFPQANIEIKAAGTCYAIGGYNACVFHLMRAAEVGARSMVTRLKVQKHLIRNGRPIPLELCDWGTLIAALEKGVQALSQGTATSKRKKDNFEFYNHAVGAFRNFKDAWRNNVSHMRKDYKQDEAKDIIDNTRQFMRHLATKLQE
jgi:hypothetical protein